MLSVRAFWFRRMDKYGYCALMPWICKRWASGAVRRRVTVILLPGRLRVPAEKLDLTVTPKVADQEMRLTVRYWEGAVVVTGRVGDQNISGQGYLEMTRPR